MAENKEDKKAPKGVMTVQDAERVMQRIQEDGGTIGGVVKTKKVNRAVEVLRKAKKWGEFGKDGKIVPEKK